MTEQDEIAATIPPSRLARIKCFEDAVALARVICADQGYKIVDSLATSIYQRAPQKRGL